MLQPSNYYQVSPGSGDNSSRFPVNHVKYSKLLKPLEWIDRFYEMFGSRAFRLENDILKEFDRAAPLDEYIGTRAELKKLRDYVKRYCEGVDNNPYTSSIGRFLLKKIMLDFLKTRKKVLEYYHSNKDFIESNGRFKAPVIITGAPRTGTTLLQRLMSEDPNTRSPYTFEFENPTPPMTREINPLEDPRIKKSEGAMSTITFLAPGFMEKLAESHYWSATEMEESLTYMLAHNGINVMNCPTSGKAFLDIFLSEEYCEPAFRYERLFFTMLDAYRPAKTHWTLKAPPYASLFPNIFKEYPDARVVVTHRNPLTVLPSVCRLLESWCIAFDQDGSFDKHRFGELAWNVIDKFLMGPFNFRRNNPEKEAQIFDCRYKEFFADPISMVKNIYRKFNLEYTDEFEERMKNYLQNNKQGKYGRHKYSLEEYGFDNEQIYRKYKEYMDHYGFSSDEKIVRPESFSFALE